MIKAQVLARSYEDGRVEVYQVVINGLLEEEITCNDDNRLSAAKKVAEMLDLYGVRVGKYSELNGKRTYAQCRESFNSQSINDKKMYDFHWLLLNEMLKLSKPEGLEARAA